MPFPKTSKTRAAIVVGIAATSALMIVGPGSTAATAGRLIGSAAIKNNTIRSLDIRDATITGRDVKDGSLTAKDFSGALRGPAGPRGLAGPPGTAGGTGGGDARTIRTWTIRGADANHQAVVAKEWVPDGTLVEVVNMVVTDGFSDCPDRGRVTLSLTGSRPLALSQYRNGAWTTSQPDGSGQINDRERPLVAYADCQDEFVAEGEPVPEFDAVITLAFTKLDTTGTKSFN